MWVPFSRRPSSIIILGMSSKVGFPLGHHVSCGAIQFVQCISVVPFLHLGGLQYGTGLTSLMWHVIAWLWHEFWALVSLSYLSGNQVWKGNQLIGWLNLLCTWLWSHKERYGLGGIVTAVLLLSSSLLEWFLMASDWFPKWNGRHIRNDGISPSPMLLLRPLTL